MFCRRAAGLKCVSLLAKKRDNPELLCRIPSVSATSESRTGITIVDHPLIRVKVARMRDQKTGAEEFRRLLREISALLVFEVTRDFETKATQVQTPLALCPGSVLARPVIIAPILRAGLGMVDGLLHAIPEASVGHIGMFRNEETLRPESYYFNLPAHLPEAEVIVVDPMLATGWSATAAITKIKEAGAQRIRFLCLLSCREGLDQLRGAHPDVPIFTAVVDAGLNERGYILPGLGDAGDRYFGTYPAQAD